MCKIKTYTKKVDMNECDSLTSRHKIILDGFTYH